MIKTPESDLNDLNLCCEAERKLFDQLSKLITASVERVAKFPGHTASSFTDTSQGLKGNAANC